MDNVDFYCTGGSFVNHTTWQISSFCDWIVNFELSVHLGTFCVWNFCSNLLNIAPYCFNLNPANQIIGEMKVYIWLAWPLCISISDTKYFKPTLPKRAICYIWFISFNNVPLNIISSMKKGNNSTKTTQ